MKSTFKASYIMPYYHTPKNFKFLKQNINELLKSPDIQIIIVETGKKPVLSEYDLKSKHVFVESEKWNLGWLYNVGRKYATSDNLFFGEHKLRTKIEVLASLLNQNKDNEYVDVQEQTLIMSMEDIINNNYNLEGKLEINQRIHFYTSGGYEKAAGFDELVNDENLSYIQEKRNKIDLKKGMLNSVTYFLDIDKMESFDDSKNKDKILQLEGQKLLNYMSVQRKKKGNIYKYQINDLTKI
jgi:hypothetical protein